METLELELDWLVLECCDERGRLLGFGWFTGNLLAKVMWDENKEEPLVYKASSLTSSINKGFVKTWKLSIWEGVNNISNYSFPFSECGSKEGIGKMKIEEFPRMKDG